MGHPLASIKCFPAAPSPHTVLFFFNHWHPWKYEKPKNLLCLGIHFKQKEEQFKIYKDIFLSFWILEYLFIIFIIKHITFIFDYSLEGYFNKDK